MESTQNKISLEEVLVARVRQSIGEIGAITHSIVMDQQNMHAIQRDITQRKASNPELTHIDVMNLLIESQEIVLLTQLREKDLREAVNNLTLLNEICVTQGIDTNLSEEERKDVDQLMATTKKLFSINTDTKEMKVIDMEAYNEILAPIRAQIRSDERMREIFNSPVFTNKI